MVALRAAAARKLRSSVRPLLVFPSCIEEAVRGRIANITRLHGDAGRGLRLVRLPGVWDIMLRQPPLRMYIKVCTVYVRGTHEHRSKYVLRIFRFHTVQPYVDKARVHELWARGVCECKHVPSRTQRCVDRESCWVLDLA